MYAAWFLHTIWNVTSRYGTSLGRWATWTIGLCFVVFPLMAMFLKTIPGGRITDYLFASFLAFATVSVPGKLTSVGEIIFGAEIMIGYIFLAVLATLIFRKVGR